MLRIFAAAAFVMAIGAGLAAYLSLDNLVHNFQDLIVWYNSGIMAVITGLACAVCLFAGIEFSTDYRLSAWVVRKRKSKQKEV